MTENSLTNALLFDTSALHKPRFDADSVAYPIRRIRQKYADQCTIVIVTDEDFEGKIKDPLLIVDIDKVGQVITQTDYSEWPLIFIVGFHSDELLESFLVKVSGIKNVFYFGLNHVYPPARYFQTNIDAEESLRLAEEKVLQHQTRINLGDYENIIQALESTRKLAGVYIEIGVFRGNSAVTAMEYVKQAKLTKRQCYFFDTYEGFTYDAAYASQDARFVDTHCDETSLTFVKSRLIGYENCHVKKLNIITDSLPSEINSCSVVNIDVDSFEATQSAIEKLAPIIDVGGIMILEDYGHTPATLGGYFAVKLFMKTSLALQFTPVHLPTGQLFLVRHS